MAVADLGIDGRGAPPDVWALPPHRESGGCAPSEGAGGHCGVWGEVPQKLKPKNTLEASQKALW